MTITNTEPTTAQYNARTEAAQKLHDRAVTMLHQSVETLTRAMQAHGLNIAVDGVSGAPIPQLGISEAADRCHVAETSLEALASGILLDLQGAIDNAERPMSFPELEVDGEQAAVGRRLGEMRRAAGLSVEAIAFGLEDERDGSPVPVGWVEGVEAGTYAAGLWNMRTWAVLCGSSAQEALNYSEPLTEQERGVLFLLGER